MLTEPQKRWVAALRGGEFKQCRGQLSKNGGYCCLGVVCEIFREELSLEKHELTFGDGYSYNESYQYLPCKVKEYLALNTTEGYFRKKDGKGEYLSNLNDDGASFEEIADIIEENADQIFTKETKSE